MIGLGNLPLFEVRSFKAAVDAGLKLKTDQLQLHRSKASYVVQTPGATKVWVFDDFINAWCQLVGRTQECPHCKGNGYTGNAEREYPPIVCSFCGEFGRVTEAQLFEMRTESLFPGGE